MRELPRLALPWKESYKIYQMLSLLLSLALTQLFQQCIATATASWPAKHCQVAAVTS